MWNIGDAIGHNIMALEVDNNRHLRLYDLHMFNTLYIYIYIYISKPSISNEKKVIINYTYVYGWFYIVFGIQ